MIQRWYAIQMQWIHALHNAVRSPSTDQFFIGWNYVDTFAFAVTLIAIVLVLIDRKIGIKLFYILMISSIFNIFFKKYFGMPRPCQIDPSAGLMCSSSNGFPSGAAQTAILLAGILILECKRRFYWIFGILFALLLCFSRVYLGMHYPTDILGGLVVGGVLLWMYWKIFPKCEQHWKWWAFLFPILLAIFWQNKDLKFSFTSMGFALGLWFYDQTKQKQAKVWGVRIAQTIVVVLGVLGANKATYLFPQFKVLFAGLGGFWLSFLGGRLIHHTTALKGE